MRYDGDHIVPKTESVFVRFVRLQGSKAATISNSLHNLSSPPNIPLPKWDTCPASQNVICRKKFLGAIQIFAAGLTANPYRTFRSLCSIQRCGQSNPLDTLVRAAKHHQHDQIARWIFDGASLCFCHLQNRPCNNYCTHPRVCEDPSHPRLDVVLKV